MCKSVPHMVVSVTRMTASPGPGFGMGTCSIAIWFGPRKTKALIVVVDFFSAGTGAESTVGMMPSYPFVLKLGLRGAVQIPSG
jgi:hypothetical protein